MPSPTAPQPRPGPIGWRHRLAGVLVGALAAIGCGGWGGADLSGLTEASANFDLQNVEPFLLRVAAQVDGLGTEEVNVLVREVSAMSPDAEESWAFEVVYQGVVTPLHIRVFMDDVDAPDVYFFTSPELAEAINKQMTAYFEELGI